MTQRNLTCYNLLVCLSGGMSPQDVALSEAAASRLRPSREQQPAAAASCTQLSQITTGCCCRRRRDLCRRGLGSPDRCDGGDWSSRAAPVPPRQQTLLVVLVIGLLALAAVIPQAGRRVKESVFNKHQPRARISDQVDTPYVVQWNTDICITLIAAILMSI